MEEWRVYPKDSRYSISNKGGVKSRCLKDERLLTPSPAAKGYLALHIGTKTTYIHHLVWDTFGTSERNLDNYEVNHINHNKQDNSIENLEYVPREINRQNNSSKYDNTKMKYLTKSRKGFALRIQRNHQYIVNRWFSDFEEACKERDKYL